MPGPTRKMADKSPDTGEVRLSWRGGDGKKKLITIEAGICMKTNKTTTICPARKRHFCKTKRHFMQKHRLFAEIGGFFVTFGALGNESCASKCRNSKGERRWETEDEGGVEPPHSKVLRTAVFTRAGVARTCSVGPRLARNGQEEPRTYRTGPRYVSTIHWKED